MPYRHEWKHPITLGDLLLLRGRLGSVLAHDSHTVGGEYFVRSLYFDNADDKVLREKINGVSRREKFRLRYYNGDTSTLRLEKKSKINGLCRKESVPLPLEQVQSLLRGDTWWMKAAPEPLVRELYAQMSTQGLRPKTVVDYTREPFVFAPGNVRVTLDYNLRTAVSSGDFLRPDCLTLPAAENPMILEVKWDEFLPDIVRDLVQLPSGRTAAFSKYAHCRLYG